MKEQIQERIEQLKNEYVTGQQKLMEVEAQTRTLREALFRISGAIQVLEEELQAEEKKTENNSEFAEPAVSAMDLN